MADQITTTATTVQPTPTPALPITGETAGFIGTGVASIIAAILWLRRKASRDGVEVIKDRTEGALLTTALDERNKAMVEAREAWAKANADAGLIGQLRAENEYLKREVELARLELAEIRRGVQFVGKKVDSTKAKLEQVERRTGTSGIAPLGKE